MEVSSEYPSALFGIEFPPESEALVGRLRSSLNSPGFRPPLLSSTALRLLEVARDPDVPLLRVRELVEKEPLLAGRVLQVAQSSFYTRGNPVETLDEALMRLGVRKLSEIFLDIAMRASIFESKRFEDPMEQLRRHSTATAHVARAVCQVLGQPGERAFLCGLLHDSGIAACVFALDSFDPADLKDTRLIWNAVYAIHEEASMVLGKSWQLPAGIRWVLGHHHHFRSGNHVNPLAALTCLADWLASEAGAPALGEVNTECAHDAADYFRLDQPSIDRLLATAERIVGQLSFDV